MCQGACHMDWKIVGLILLVLVCSSFASLVVMRMNQKPATLPPVTIQQTVPAAPPVVLTEAPTEPPRVTTAPPTSAARADVMLYAPGSPYWAYAPGFYGPTYAVPPVPRYPKMWWPPAPRPIQPGGSWPELMGKDYQDAAAYVMSTYPNMHIAMVRYGAAMPADSRQDRFIIVYDAWTRKVVGAQIG